MGKENFGCSAQEHDDLKVMTHHIQSATKIKCDPRKSSSQVPYPQSPKKGDMVEKEKEQRTSNFVHMDTVSKERRMRGGISEDHKKHTRENEIEL